MDFLSEINLRVRTTEDVVQLKADVELLDQAKYLISATKRKSLLEKCQPWIVEMQDKPDQLNRLLEVGGWPVIKLKIATTLNPAGIILISDWLRKNVHPNLIIDFEIDPGIGAGVVIVFDGQLRDYSFQKLMFDGGLYAV